MADNKVPKRRTLHIIEIIILFIIVFFIIDVVVKKIDDPTPQDVLRQHFDSESVEIIIQNEIKVDEGTRIKFTKKTSRSTAPVECWAIISDENRLFKIECPES